MTFVGRNLTRKMLNETLAEPEYARQVECVIMNTAAHMLCVCGYNVQQQVISMSSTQLFTRPEQPPSRWQGKSSRPIQLQRWETIKNLHLKFTFHSKCANIPMLARKRAESDNKKSKKNWAQLLDAFALYRWVLCVCWWCLCWVGEKSTLRTCAHIIWYTF